MAIHTTLSLIRQLSIKSIIKFGNTNRISIDQTNINQIKSIIKLSYLRCFFRCLARHITLSLIRQLSKHPNKNNTNLRCSSLCLASSELPPPSPSSTSTPPSSSQQPSGDPPLLFCYQADPLFSLPFILSVSHLSSI